MNGPIGFINPDLLSAYADTAGDGIPTLCVVEGNPVLATECLVEGVEALHIEYGIDSDGDGVPETFQASPSTTEMGDAVTANIYLLMRDTEPDFNYDNTNTYTLGSKAPITVNDHYHRAIYNTTAVIQNQRTLPIRG
ncbi:MAG: PilW family protein [Candidatus Competibacteraceae bacterium]